MRPSTETGFQGSRSKAVLKRITTMISSYPTVFCFHLLHLEVHRDREDRENVRLRLLNNTGRISIRPYYMAHLSDNDCVYDDTPRNIVVNI